MFSPAAPPRPHPFTTPGHSGRCQRQTSPPNCRIGQRNDRRMNQEKARQLYAKLLANCGTRPTGRAEVAQARNYLAKGS